MKIDQRRAISQSLDLFIIIGAVLAVGGVVTSSVFGLVNGNSQNTAFQVTAISASGGTGTNLVNSFNIVLKNIGSSSIKGPMTITLVNAMQGTGATACSVTPTVVTTAGSTAGTGWTLTCAANSSVTINGPSSGTSLSPGGQISISVGTIPESGSTPTSWAPGVVQTVSVTFGVASASTTVTS